MARGPRIDREVQRIQSRLDYINTKKHFVPDETNLEEVAQDGHVPRCGFFGSVTDSALQRLAYTANCSRIGSDVYPALRSCLSNFLARACLNADVLADHRGKTNITGPDVLYGLKAMDVHVHGTGKLKRLRPKAGNFNPDDYPVRFAADSDTSATIHYYVIDLQDLDVRADDILDGLAEYRQTKIIKSELAIIVNKFSKVRGNINVVDLDNMLKTSGTLIKAYYRNGPINQLVGFMIVRRWNPCQLERERIQTRTGYDITQSVPANNMDDLIRFREMFCTAANLVGPVRQNEIYTDDPAEFQDGGSAICPSVLTINNSPSVIQSIKDGKHWTPVNGTPETWSNVLSDHVKNIRRYSIHIVDMAFRSFYDPDSKTLISYVDMETMMEKTLREATRDWVVLNPTNEYSYFERAVGLGGLIMTFPKRLAHKMTTDGAKFTRVNVYVNHTLQPFTIDDTEIMWRPVKLAGPWMR